VLIAVEAGPVPMTLVAVTLIDWTSPSVSPVIVQVVAPEVVHVLPAGSPSRCSR